MFANQHTLLPYLFTTPIFFIYDSERVGCWGDFRQDPTLGLANYNIFKDWMPLACVKGSVWGFQGGFKVFASLLQDDCMAFTWGLHGLLHDHCMGHYMTFYMATKQPFLLCDQFCGHEIKIYGPIDQRPIGG
jgi:hypothetical protein